MGDPGRPVDRIIAKRLTLAGLSACAVLIFFFWTGNFQAFLDSSLLLLLRILSWTAPIVAILSLWGLVAAILRPKAGEGRWLRAWGIAGYSLTFLFCVALFLLGHFLMAVLQKA